MNVFPGELRAIENQTCEVGQTHHLGRVCYGSLKTIVAQVEEAEPWEVAQDLEHLQKDSSGVTCTRDHTFSE